MIPPCIDFSFFLLLMNDTHSRLQNMIRRIALCFMAIVAAFPIIS